MVVCETNTTRWTFSCHTRAQESSCSWQTANRAVPMTCVALWLLLISDWFREQSPTRRWGCFLTRRGCVQASEHIRERYELRRSCATAGCPWYCRRRWSETAEAPGARTGQPATKHSEVRFWVLHTSSGSHRVRQAPERPSTGHGKSQVMLCVGHICMLVVSIHFMLALPACLVALVLGGAWGAVS